MTMKRAGIVWVGVLSLAVGLSGASAAERADDSEVPLYTNADLEKFATPVADLEQPAAPAGETEVLAGPPPSASVDNPWEFVWNFIDRERAQIDAQHRQAVERAAVEASEVVEPEGEPGFDYPVAIPYIGFPDWWCNRDRRCCDKEPVYRPLPQYDHRTARHGYLVPREHTSPDRVAHPHPRSNPTGVRRARSTGANVPRAGISASASRGSGTSARRATSSSSARRSSGVSSRRAASGRSSGRGASQATSDGRGTGRR
jgi:hypothetical protein